MTAAPQPQKTYLACVRLHDKPDTAGMFIDDTARIRYTNGHTYTGFRDVHTADLAAATGHDLDYWRHLNIAANTIIAAISYLTQTGTIGRPVTDFGELHDFVDANTGWSKSIDQLDHDQWTYVQWLVADLLRFP